MVVNQDLEIMLRILLSFFLGALVGIEREKRHKPAGVRTHALVSMGAGLFTVISAYGFAEFAGMPHYGNMDPARVAAQIVSGVGFIGAGLIFKNRDNVRGLTTAASIWMAAAIGTGVGAGMYAPVMASTALALIALKFNSVLKRFGMADEGK
ncbi:MAG: MgtC/SapB family protein [Firmicutes bacterium]|nr:MgtC/SapB family protein [Bacillota bacterium]